MLLPEMTSATPGRDSIDFDFQVQAPTAPLRRVAFNMVRKAPRQFWKFHCRQFNELLFSKS
jgi:hypothetical protein